MRTTDGPRTPSSLATLVIALSLVACGDDAMDPADGGGGATAGSTSTGASTTSTTSGSAGGGDGEGGEAGSSTTSAGGDDPGAGGAGGEPGSGGAGTAPAIPFTCPGGSIVDGENELQVGDRTRTLLADLPADTSGPVGVVFSWHGFGDSAPSFRAASALDPDADPSLPLIVITPEDSGMLPPAGLDWDIARGTEDDDNRDLAFFEAMLGCLDEQYAIDPSRIYTHGFSAGSVMSSLLHSRYPGLLSAIVNVSGVWFNDEAQQDLVNLISIDWNWPALDPADGGAVLLTHGGPDDVTVGNLMNLEDAAQAAFPFLAAANRVVIDCAHEQGHTPHPEVTPQIISRFLSMHRAGEASPLLDEELEGWPASCQIRRP